MKNSKFKKIAKYLVILFSILLIPQALNIQSELSMRTIISAIAVDLNKDEFVVTAQVVKPSSTAEGGGTELDFLSASGKTIADAVDAVSVALGRTSGLAHIGTIIIGEEVIKKDKLMPALDYFLREKGIQNSAMLLVSEDEAKKTLENTKKLQLSSAVGLPKVFLYKQNNSNGIMMQLQHFLNDYFTLSNCSVISGVKIEGKDDMEKEEIESSSQSGSSSESSGSSSGGSGGSSGGNSGGSTGGESGGGSSGGSEQKDGRIKYLNNVYVFDNGKLVHTIKDEDSLKGLNLINRNSHEGVISVENINNQYVSNAKVSVYYRDKKVKIKTDWSTGKPKCIFTIITNRNEVYSIEAQNPKEILYETEKSYLTDDVVDAVENKITECVKKAFTECQSVGADIYQLANRLHQRNPKKWNDFYSQYGDDYIKHIDIEVDVKFKRQI